MKYKRFAVIAATCAAMVAPAAHAASSSAWASIYDITFEVLNGSATFFSLSDEGLDPGASEATLLQNSAGGVELTVPEDGSIQFARFSQLYATAALPASLTESGGSSNALAASGSSSSTQGTTSHFVSASGSSNISGQDPMNPFATGSFYAGASLNQAYFGTSTLGGLLWLSAGATIVMHGAYDLLASVTGPSCGSFGMCSGSMAQVQYGIGGFDELNGVPTFALTEQLIQVDGLDLGGVSGSLALRGQIEELSFYNDSPNRVPVWFQTAAYATGHVGTGIAAPVPEPETYAMMALGLGIVGWLARRRPRAAERDETLLPVAA